MSKESRRLQADSAYRIKRARKKKPMRLVELGIVALFLVVVAYVASFTVQITKGYSQEKPVMEYFLNLQILNGCGKRGVAGQVTESLEKKIQRPLTIRVVDSDNFEHFNVDTTFIISRKADLTAAQLLARQLGLDDQISFRAIDDNYLDIGATLVLGTDYQRLLVPLPAAATGAAPQAKE